MRKKVATLTVIYLQNKQNTIKPDFNSNNNNKKTTDKYLKSKRSAEIDGNYYRNGNSPKHKSVKDILSHEISNAFAAHIGGNKLKKGSQAKCLPSRWRH